MRALRMTTHAVTAGALLLAMGTLAAAQQADHHDETRPLDTIRKVSNIMDARVLGQGKDLRADEVADLADLMMDTKGQIHYVVLGAGGLLGIGEDHVAVPFQKVQTMQRDNDGNWTVTIPMTKDQIERAPTIKNTDFRPLTNSDWLQKNNVFFGVEPSPEDTGIALYRASELLGATVTNSQDEKLASIDDLLLDGHGRAVYAILGAGGFLGIGEDHLAIPFSRLNIMYYPEREEVEATLNTTREKLEASPRMTGRDYDKLRDADYVVQVTRYYVDVDSDDEQP